MTYITIMNMLQLIEMLITIYFNHLMFYSLYASVTSMLQYLRVTVLSSYLTYAFDILLIIYVNIKKPLCFKDIEIHWKELNSRQYVYAFLSYYLN